MNLSSLILTAVMLCSALTAREEERVIEEHPVHPQERESLNQDLNNSSLKHYDPNAGARGTVVTPPHASPSSVPVPKN